MAAYSIFLPPEWAPQSAILLTWPHLDSDWGPALAEVEPVFIALADTICRYEYLLVAVHNQSVGLHVAHCLNQAGVAENCYSWYVAPSNDTWARDHGPITVIENGYPVLLDFRFNGWGGKFQADLDNALTLTLHNAKAFGATPLRRVPFVLEGGSIEVDGRGSLLTTANCLLAPTRNPGWNQAEIETELRNNLGIQRVLWLYHGGLIGDDTDGHIDTLARFCAPNLIAYQSCPDASDEHFESLRAMAEELTYLRRPEGSCYDLIPLPWPAPHYGTDGQRLPATYANFLIINGAVLVPTYADPADHLALAILQNCFPGRQVIGIPSSALILQNGSLHCLTMQLPAGVIINPSKYSDT